MVISGIGLIYGGLNYLKQKDPFDIFAVSFIALMGIGLIFASIRLRNEVANG